MAPFANYVVMWMTDIIFVTHCYDGRPTLHECLEIAFYDCTQGFEEALDFLWELYDGTVKSWDDPFEFLDDGHHDFVWFPTFPVETDHHTETDTPNLVVQSYKENGRPCVTIRFPVSVECEILRAIELIHGVWYSHGGFP